MKNLIIALIQSMAVMTTFASWDGTDYWASIKDKPTGTVTANGVTWKFYVYESYDYAAVWPDSALPNDVIVPEMVDGHIVGEFYGVGGSAPWSVSIPGSIRVVEQANFTEGVSLLTNLCIRDDVSIDTVIEEGAFDGCENLRAIYFGEGVVEIGRWAFRGSAALEKVVLPSTLRSVGAAAFAELGSDWYVSPELMVFLEGDEYGNFYIDDWLITMNDPSQIREGTRGIGDDAIRNDSLNIPAVLPDGIEYIGERACGGFLPDYIPESVKFIGNSAFGEPRHWYNTWDVPFIMNMPDVDENNICYYCGWCFGPVDMDEWSRDEMEGDDVYGDDEWYKFWKEEEMNRKRNLYIQDGTIGVASGAFSAVGYCGENNVLTNIHFPESLQFIGNSAFENCSALKAFNTPSNVVSMGKFAFSQCAGLGEVRLGDKQKVLEYGVFYNIYNLTNIYCSAEYFETLCLYSYYHHEYQKWDFKTGKTETIIEHNEGPVKNLHLTSKIKYVGRPAWHAVNIIYEEGVTDIGKIIGGEGAGEVVIPSSVTNISDNAFDACPALSNVIIKIVNSADVKFTGKVFNGKYQIKVVALPYNAKGYDDLIAQLGADKVKFTVGTESGFGQWVLVNGLAGQGSAADFGGKSGGNKYENGFLYIFGNGIENKSVALIQLDKTKDGQIAFRIPETEHEDKVRVVGTANLNDWSNAVELKKDGDVWVMPDGTKPPDSFFCRVIISE